MGSPHLGISSRVNYNQMDDKLQAYDPFKTLILNLHFSTLMTIITWCHPVMGYMELPFWCKPMERYLTPHSNAKHIDHGLVYKALLARLTIPLDSHVARCLCFVCWPTKIHTLLFYLVNLVSSHDLSQSLEVHKEFFTWLYALSQDLDPQWLNT